jgi:hypothetical protein
MNNIGGWNVVFSVRLRERVIIRKLSDVNIYRRSSICIGISMLPDLGPMSHRELPSRFCFLSIVVSLNIWQPKREAHMLMTVLFFPPLYASLNLIALLLPTRILMDLLSM